MSEGWSDGMLGSTGLYWYQSTPRMAEAIRATMLLDGSPVFAPAGETGFEIKEGDYIEENVRDMLTEEDDDFVASVATTLQALEQGDWTTAESTAYGKMTLEEKMAMELTMNTTLHTITDFADLPAEYGQTGAPAAYDQATLVNALKQYDPTVRYEPGVQRYTADVSCWYFYHNGLQQWWGQVTLPDHSSMLIPLVIGFYIEGRDTLQEIRDLHAKYPNTYAKDIAALAAFEAARQV